MTIKIFYCTHNKEIHLVCLTYESISTERTYYFFDKDDQLQTKTLSGYQCWQRNIFGCYPETHFPNLVKKAYEITLRNPPNVTPEQKQKILAIIAQAQADPSFAYYSMYKEPHPLPIHIRVGVRYQFNKSSSLDRVSDDHIRTISAVNIILKFLSPWNDDHECHHIERLQFDKKTEKIWHVSLLDLSDKIYPKGKQRAKIFLPEVETSVINKVIKKILFDTSKASSSVCLGIYCSDGYRAISKKALEAEGWTCTPNTWPTTEEPLFSLSSDIASEYLAQVRQTRD
jgi:hypothetical protein